MGQVGDQLVRFRGDHGRGVEVAACLWVRPWSPQAREDEDVPGGRGDRARRALLGARGLRPLEPCADGDQAPLGLEGLRVEPAGGDLVGPGVEGEVFRDEGPAGSIRGQEPP